MVIAHKHLSGRVFLLAVIAIMIWPIGALTVEAAHSAEYGGKSCSGLTKTDASRIAVIKSFLVPRGAAYNVGAWPAPDKQSPHYKWIDKDMVLDESGFHRTGQMLSGGAFALFGPRAGPSWIVFDKKNTADTELSAALGCSGYKVQPTEDPLLRPTVWRAHRRKQNDFIGVEGLVE